MWGLENIYKEEILGCRLCLYFYIILNIEIWYIFFLYEYVLDYFKLIFNGYFFFLKMFCNFLYNFFFYFGVFIYCNVLCILGKDLWYLFVKIGDYIFLFDNIC